MTFALLVLSGCNEKKNEPSSDPTGDVPVMSITVSPKSCEFTEVGKTVQLVATVLPADATNPKVTWKSSDPEVATVNSDGLVTSVGGGEAIITATAGDQSATCKVIVNDGTIKDLCSNRYKMITIGKQVWLDGNFRCNKYDTESGLYGDECPVFVTDEQGAKSKSFNRYCVDASNKENWDSDQYAMDLTQDQVNQLGYLYNWSAAMALSAAEAKAQTQPFEGLRQGICPNGWHVPTNEDWEELIEHGGGGGSTGSYLKATTGWYNNGNGEDRFGFAALPVDVADGSTVSNVGRYASFWTATPFTVDGTKVFYRRIDYNWGSLALSNDPKDVAIAVRCLKNPEEDPEE